MDWKTIAPLVGSVAPFAGKLIGGLIPFPGAALAGEMFGNIIAKQLGVPPTPQAVSDALVAQTEETRRATISAAVEEARVHVQGFVDIERAYLDAEVKNAADVNATIRVEAAAPESLFYRGWRPAFGWCFVAIWSVFGLALTYVTLRAAWLSPNPLQTLKDAWPLFASYFGPGAAVLGVLIPSRSYEKGKAIENSAPVVLPKAAPKIPIPPAKPIPGPRIIPAPPGSRT